MYWIGFVDFMLKSKSLLEYTNLFSPNDYEKEWSYNILKIPIIKKMKKTILCYL